MSSWWDLSNGQKATGNEADAFIAPMGVIPDGTQAVAKIQKMTVELKDKGFINIQWKLIEGEFPDYGVISYQEVVPEIRIQPLGRIQLT